MADDIKPPLTTTTSIWPAAAVLGVAVVMLSVFLIINFVTDQSVTTHHVPASAIVVGGLSVDPHVSPALTYCSQGEEVPTNITDVFIFPVTTVSLSGADTPNSGAGEFDCYEHFMTHADASSLLAFYGSHLQTHGWKLFSRGAANGDPQSLFQKAGNDGFYWVAGITVTTSHSGSVSWTLRLYQNSETI